MKELLEKIQIWGLATLVFLLPLFFLPFTPDFFDFNKTALLVAGGLILFTLYALRSLFTGEIRLRISQFDLPVLAIAAAFVLTTFATTPNKMEAILSPGLTTVILTATLLYFLVLQNGNSHLRFTVYGLLFSGLILALVSIAASTGLLETIPNLPPYIRQKTFSLAGAPLSTITFLLVLLPLAVSQVIGNRQSVNRRLFTIYHLLFTIVLALGIISVTIHALPGKPASPRILPLGTGWAVAVETLKNSPLFGAGIGNFLSAFNQYRPVSYNLTDNWNLRFAASSNWYLHLLTEVGILGLGAFIFLVWKIVKAIGKWSTVNGNYHLRFTIYGLLLILLLLLIIPANFLLLVTFYLLLGLVASSVASETTLKFQALPALFLILTSLFTASVFFFGARFWQAEAAFKQALEAAARNEGTATYNLLRRAISLNPSVDRYRLTYAQTNLALANAIAQKEKLTDEDRQTIGQLVQQAIREGKAGVSLNTTRSNNWEVLARIYRSLIPFAQGSDQWAISTYSQAVVLEPTNPNLRIALGGVFYSLGRYDDAVRAFELAVLAKPDLANAHYNLAAALREKQDFKRAVSEMERTLALVRPDSADYQVAQSELEGLRKRLAESIEGSGETLSAPQAAPTPVIKPPLQLPSEASPPATP